MIYLRNRKTTEFKSVDDQSDEFFELTGQRDPDDGRPIWEQTSRNDVREQEQRIEDGQPRDEDLGDDEQPVERMGLPHEIDSEAFDPDAHAEPTPGEAAQGAGRAAEQRPNYDRQKVAALKKQIEERDLDLPEEGSGEDGRVVKEDLVEVLQKADAGE